MSPKSSYYFEDLPLDALKYKVLFIDIDGTLTHDSSSHVSKVIIDKINELKKYNQIFLCTNSRNLARNNELVKQFKLKIANFKYKKPSRKILKEIHIDTDRSLVVIGDKFLIDGLFAKNIGAEFIMTKRYLSGKEFLKIKLFNFVDDMVCYLLRFLHLAGL